MRQVPGSWWRFWDREPATLLVLLILGVILYAVVRAVTGEGIHLTRNVSTEVGDLLSFSLSCALLAYGTIEAVKRIMRVRGWFQLRQTRRWLEQEPEGEAAFSQLLELMGVDYAGPAAERAFNLPIEQLTAQIGTAADLALADPSPHTSLVTVLAGRRQSILFNAPAETTEGPELPKEHESFELAQGVRAGIDRLQISVGEQWLRAVQSATMAVAGLYGIGLVHAAQLPDRSEPRYVLAALLVGGPIAWSVRDAAALLERARR